VGNSWKRRASVQLVHGRALKDCITFHDDDDDDDDDDDAYLMLQ
jgi:hypothetical protein